jgi:hypothetical protein
MGVSIEYRLDGQEVERERFLREVEDHVRALAIDQLREKVERIRCLRHHQTAKLRQLSLTSEGLEIRLAGCCDDLVECVLRELG